MLPSEEAAAVTDRQIKALISGRGGAVLDELPPRLFTLAYTVKKVIEHKSKVFTEAYWGTGVFELTPAAVLDLSNELRRLPAVVRFLMLRQPAPAKPSPVPSARPATR